MMPKLTDITGINAGINPVARIMPVLAVESIGSTTQELADRATQFVKGQAYIAQVLSKAGDTAYNVKVEGTILKMELGTAAQAGQTLLLRYLHDSPARTFALASASTQGPSPGTVQFVRGREYIAQILSKAGDTTYNVKVDGAILKAELGATVQAGQTLLLRYLHDSPAQTFALASASTQGPSPGTLQFVRGQAYIARILSKVGDTTYNVKVDGAILKAELGATVQAGQTLLLRYMHNSPLPTFLLAPASTGNAGSIADLSPAAHLIGQYLKEAEGNGVSTRYDATIVITHSPKNPQVMAQDLKHAVSNSGLFYESHLGDLIHGSRSLAAIMQEPQNQSGLPVAALMSQQLAVLENQRMAWHGEVWPGQEMSWDVYLQQRNSERDGDRQAAGESVADEPRPIASELTLHLPHLGKVSAKLSLVDGRMRINILAEQAQTLDTLKAQRQNLAEAIVKSGQQLDALTVMRDG